MIQLHKPILTDTMNPETQLKPYPSYTGRVLRHQCLAFLMILTIIQMGLTTEVADHRAAFSYDRVNTDAFRDSQVITFVEKLFKDNTSYLILAQEMISVTLSAFLSTSSASLSWRWKGDFAILGRHRSEGPRCTGTCTGLFGLGSRMRDG